MSTNFRIVKNNAFSYIPAGELDNTDVNIPVDIDSGETFPETPSGKFFRVTIWDDKNFKRPKDDPDMEIADATKEDNVLVLERGKGNTTPVARNRRLRVEILLQDEDISDLQEAVNDLEDSQNATYTQEQIDSFLAQKSDTDHTHDDRYYKKDEVESLVIALSAAL